MSSNNDKKTLKEARDFQPDAIMLETHTPPIPLHIVWYLVLILLVGGVIWSCLAKVDKVIVAHGKIVTDRPTLVIKPLERTIVKEVHVRIGQKVKKDDLLFTFDQTTNQAEYDRLNDQLKAFQAQAARLKSETEGYDKDFKMPANPNKYDYLQHSTFESRKSYYIKKLLAYDVSKIRYQKTLEQLRESMTKFEARKSKLDEIESMMSSLEDNRAVSLRDLLNVQVQVLETGIAVDQQLVSIVENEQTIKTVDAERAAFDSDWKRQVYEELVEVDRSISSIEQQMKQTEVLVNFTELKAPCDGVVHEIAPYQEGSAVREAESLITIIPTGVELEAEVDIPAKDISRVALGNTCRLKFDTFPFQQCGTLDGTLDYISEDAFTGKQSLASMTQEDMVGDAGGRLSKNALGTTYQARIKINDDEDNKLHGRAEGAKIMPGMTLSAEIKVGERTVINYILNPLVKAMDESIREP